MGIIMDMDMSMNRNPALKTDFHSHCLPAMDDGAADVETAVAMLRMLAKQGIETVLLTPHYYATQESVDSFLKRRETALQALRGIPDLPRLIVGAEVYLDRDIALPEISKLCIEGTDRLLLEMPFAPFSPWMAELAESCIYTGGCQLIFAHLSRYLAYYRESDFDQLLCIPQAIVQINAESLRYRPSRKQVQKWLASGVPIVYGSDTHNLTTRPPVFHKVSRWLSHPHGGVVPAQLANRLADELGLL